MKLEREKLIQYIALATAVVVTLLGLILWLLLRGEGRLEVGLALPRVTPTASVTPTMPPEQVLVTPAPTPIRLQVARDYPPGAVDLVANGRVLFTMEDVDVARETVERYLSESARLGLGPDERLIRAGFDQKITLENPSGKGELLTPEEALNSLKADDSLLPVVRTVVRCVIERGEIVTLSQENETLLSGSRIYRNMGVYPYTLSYYETVYRGQAAYSEVKTNEFTVGQNRADRVMEDGGYVMEDASREAGPDVKRVAGFQPLWLVPGAVTGSFGMTDEGMSYGVEVTAESVARVVAPEEGVIVYCGKRGSLGLVIDIQHDETGLVSRIIGCQRPLVELYQRVKRGEQVAVLPDSTIRRLVTVRYELLLNGIPVNPEKYLPKR